MRYLLNKQNVLTNLKKKNHDQIKKGGKQVIILLYSFRSQVHFVIQKIT